ncbi:MAG: hypothetical protein LBR15_11085 [Methanobrevibacter sp.]|jgi:hypothetical protein|nr:hypothetical protein [Candidatus Methanovirga australis]
MKLNKIFSLAIMTIFMLSMVVLTDSVNAKDFMDNRLLTAGDFLEKIPNGGLGTDVFFEQNIIN